MMTLIFSPAVFYFNPTTGTPRAFVQWVPVPVGWQCWPKGCRWGLGQVECPSNFPKSLVAGAAYRPGECVQSRPNRQLD
ncbi:MAG: hypothetical protein KME26_03665 [Oscillatoria princeps RMCB-10]|nr:hypothetical protein [Oscillatoria princeps RMCB-10]